MTKQDSKSNWWVWAVVAVAAVVRWPFLTGSFWLDEAAQAIESVRPWSQQFQIIPDFQPPLLHLWLRTWSIFSWSELWLRLGGAVIPGLVTIFLLYFIARKWWGAVPAVIASGLLALHPFHIFFSQELRPYSLPTMFAVIGWWLIVYRPVKSQWWWQTFVLVSIAGLYASFLYPFVLAAQLLYLWLRRPSDWLKIGVASGAIVAGFAPWLPIFRLQLAAGSVVRQSLPAWSQVVSPPPVKALALVPIKFLFGLTDFELNPWYLGSLVVLGGVSLVVVISHWRSWWHWWQARPSLPVLMKRPEVLMVVWSVLPLVAAWLVSFWIPVLQPKRVMFLLPVWCLLVAYIATQLSQARWWRWAFLAVVVVIQLVGIGQYYTNPLLQREDWRSAHQALITKYPASESIAVFVFDEPFAPWRWYDQGEYPTLALGKLSVAEVPDLVETIKPATKYRYIIVFDYLRDLSDPDDRVLQEIQAFGYRPVEILDYPNIGFIRIYARSESVVSWYAESR